MIDWNKPLRVRGDHWPAEVLGPRLRGTPFHIVCLVHSPVEDFIGLYSPDGLEKNRSRLGLENVPPPVERRRKTVWVNAYLQGYMDTLHDSQWEADAACCGERLLRTFPVLVEYEVPLPEVTAPR